MAWFFSALLLFTLGSSAQSELISAGNGLVNRLPERALLLIVVTASTVLSFDTNQNVHLKHEERAFHHDHDVWSLNVKNGQLGSRLSACLLQLDKQKARSDRAKLLKYMGWLMGLEPTTTGITIRDSTNWATATIKSHSGRASWCARRDSNPQPPA